MKTLMSAIAISFLLAAGACSHAASTPEGLAKALQSALSSGDFDAAGKLAAIEDAPAQLHFFYLDSVLTCSSGATCTVSVAPATDELRAQFKQQAAKLHAQAPNVDGMIMIAVKPKSGSGSGTMKMPYAKVGDTYKVVSIHYSPAEIAALRAKTNEALVQEFFAAGILDSGASEPRTDWATAATKLPADGGDAGKAFVAQTLAMSAAVDAKDPDAAMHAGGGAAAIIFRDKDASGKAIPLVERQRKLHVQSLRMLRDVKVTGGYLLGDSAVLVIEAHDGIGWVVRGPILLSHGRGTWQRAGDNTVSYPAGT
ncbi:MAG: hypothetical protein ABI082_10030 [Dokdonella sp.]